MLDSKNTQLTKDRTSTKPRVSFSSQCTFFLPLGMIISWAIFLRPFMYQPNLSALGHPCQLNGEMWSEAWYKFVVLLIDMNFS